MTSGERSERRVFLDANVIIEAFRIGAWKELSSNCRLETVEECEREALTGRTDVNGRVPVGAQALRAGLAASHLVSRRERNALLTDHAACIGMDPGEKDLFAHLYANPWPVRSVVVLSSADKGVIVRAKDLGWLDHLISLEELLDSCRLARSKFDLLDRQHRATFLADVRMKVMMGIIP